MAIVNKCLGCEDKRYVNYTGYCKRCHRKNGEQKR